MKNTILPAKMDELAYVQTPAEKVRQLRFQMLVHSYHYYVLDAPVVSDGKWQHWANQLVHLQKKTKIINYFDEEFADWDGSTGYHLPQTDYVRGHVERFLANRDRHKTATPVEKVKPTKLKKKPIKLRKKRAIKKPVLAKKVKKPKLKR